MGWQSGKTKEKTGGRQQGTPNRKTVELECILAKRNYSPLEALLDELPNLKADQRAKIAIELLGYIYPKRKAIETSDVTAADIDGSNALQQEVQRLADWLTEVKSVS